MADFSYGGNSSVPDGEIRYTLTKRDKAYVDISLAFTPSPVTNDITLLFNERAINNAIKNIVLVSPGEDVFFRDFGTQTNQFLFDIIDDISAGLLEQEIERAIRFCEPRVTFDSLENDTAYIQESKDSALDFEYNSGQLGVSVNAKPEQNEYEVTVRYRIVGSEQIYKTAVILTPTR